MEDKVIFKCVHCNNKITLSINQWKELNKHVTKIRNLAYITNRFCTTDVITSIAYCCKYPQYLIDNC